MIKNIFIITTIVFSLYVILGILIFYLQPRLIFMPSKKIYVNPSDIGIPFEEIFINTSDNIQINAWFINGKQGAKTILFLHGNAGNLSHRIDTVRILNKLGFSILIIDYRGYGKSKGTPTEEGTYLDAMAAWNYLIKEKGLKPKDIIIQGRSLGGGIASWLAQQSKPAALILESTFTTAPDVIRHIFWMYPLELLCRIKYPTIKRLSKITCPLLVIHSKTDETIHYSQGIFLYKKANRPKSFLEIHGEHADGYITSEAVYMEGIKNFLRTNNLN